MEKIEEQGMVDIEVNIEVDMELDLVDKEKN
jgi:hypothetical protein